MFLEMQSKGIISVYFYYLDICNTRIIRCISTVFRHLDMQRPHLISVYSNCILVCFGIYTIYGPSPSTSVLLLPSGSGFALVARDGGMKLKAVGDRASDSDKFSCPMHGEES